MVYGRVYLRTGTEVQRSYQQPINRNAKGLEESYAPGKRFDGHQGVSIISSSVRVQVNLKCSCTGNGVNDMTWTCG